MIKHIKERWVPRAIVLNRIHKLNFFCKHISILQHRHGFIIIHLITSMSVNGENYIADMYTSVLQWVNTIKAMWRRTFCTGPNFPFGNLSHALIIAPFPSRPANKNIKVHPYTSLTLPGSSNIPHCPSERTDISTISPKAYYIKSYHNAIMYQWRCLSLFLLSTYNNTFNTWCAFS